MSSVAVDVRRLLNSSAPFVVFSTGAVALLAATETGVTGGWIGYVAYLGLRATVVTGFVTASVLLWRETAQRGNAALLSATTVALIAGGVRVWTPPPLPLVVEVAAYLAVGLLGWVLLRYPYDRLEGRAARAFVVVELCWLGVGHPVVRATADVAAAHSEGWPSSAWRPTIATWFAVHHQVVQAGAAVDVLLTGCFLALLASRIRRMRGFDRWMAAPMAAAAVAVAVPLLGRLPVAVFGGDLAQSILQQAALAVVPAALGVVLVRERLCCAAVLRAARSGADVAAALRVVLRDPELRVLPAGAAVPTLVDRHPALVRDQDGACVGVVVVDSAVLARPALLRTVVEACAHALERDRLHDTVRRIERDLHDGAQQRLLALSLALTRLRLEGASVDDVIARTRAEIKAATAELRELTGGCGSAAVRRDGLRGTVADLCGRLPITAAVEIADERWAAGIEQDAYFVVCEGVANALKHATPTRLWISAGRAGDVLEVSVRDDGCGGADPGRGSGLRGLAERVRRAGGQVVVSSPPGVGTVVRATFPLAPAPAAAASTTPRQPAGRSARGAREHRRD